MPLHAPNIKHRHSMAPKMCEFLFFCHSFWRIIINDMGMMFVMSPLYYYEIPAI